MRLELILTGTELLDGRRADTHGQRLATLLRPIDLSIDRTTIVGDGQAEISDALRGALDRADLIICTGGLGPTVDDRTREAAAEVFGLPLIEDEPTLAHLRELFANFGRAMSDNNRRQAAFPEGATILLNPIGTAAGFAIEAAGKIAIFAPGPPHELEMMAREQVVPFLTAHLPPGDTIASVSLRTFGFTESGLDKRLRAVDLGEVELAFTATMPEIILTLTARHHDAEVARARLAAARSAVEGVVGDSVISDDGSELEAVVARLLAQRGQTFATAESCTGGMIAARCTGVSGSSTWFLQGAVTYSNEAKTQRLGVSAELIQSHGAVSREVAEAMAQGMRATSGADWAIGVTGIAGPTGGTIEKPVGTVHMALASTAGVEHWHDRFPGDRWRVRLLATENALDRLRRALAK